MKSWKRKWPSPYHYFSKLGRSIWIHVICQWGCDWCITPAKAWKYPSTDLLCEKIPKCSPNKLQGYRARASCGGVCIQQFQSYLLGREMIVHMNIRRWDIFWSRRKLHLKFFICVSIARIWIYDERLKGDRKPSCR